MGHLCFYLAVVAACLLWSAACTAAAARVQPGWVRRLLVVAAVAVPVVALLPWVLVTARLAFAVRLATNWFAPTVTAAIAAAVGGIWIVRGGLGRAGAAAARAWPLVGLTAMFVLATAVAAGTLLFIDNAVVAEARVARAESAAMMQSVMPPAVSADDDAAPLYRQAFELVEADAALDGDAAMPATADASSAAVADLLLRHGTTLDIVRRAADRPGCRFVRDWSRPSVDALLPEEGALRKAVRLLALAARREAATGDVRAALADVVRMHRIAAHVAAEPTLVAGFVAVATDGLALETLAAVLPAVTKTDAAALDDPALSDVVRSTPSLQRPFLGEEAMGLATFAALTDTAAFEGGDVPGSTGAEPVGMLVRCFLLPADLRTYRSSMNAYRQLVAAAAARHRAAEVLLAATRARLARGELPDSSDAIVPERLPAVPRDPFVTAGGLRVKTGADGWLVYSVGPDGEDDGGPPPAGTVTGDDCDDIGLRLAR